MRLGLALIGFFALAVVPTADAKMCVRIDAPAHVVAGRMVLVRVTTLMPTWKNGRLVRTKPFATGSGGSMTVAASGPGGEYRTLRLRRSSRPEVWIGRIAFVQRGSWELVVEAWRAAPRECGSPRTIRVT